MAFWIGFGGFLLLFAVLVVYVVRFARELGRKGREPNAGPGAAGPGAAGSGTGAEGS